jgi:predicted dehydrogenase
VGRVETSSNLTWPGPLDGPHTLDDSFVTSIHAFVEALATGRPVPTDGGDGLRVMTMEHAVLRATETGRRVTLAEP